MEQYGTFTVRSGLAEMLKGGAIMDVTNPEQAKIAEDAGAVSVMALERVPADIRAGGGRADDRSRHHRKNHEGGDHSRYGKNPDWPLCGSADPGSDRHRLYR